MKKILLLFVLIFSINTFGKIEEIKISATRYEIKESAITIDENLDLTDISIATENMLEIEMEDYIFFVNKDEFIYEHNNNLENIRRGLEPLKETKKKISKKEAKKIDFRETLFKLIKNKKVKIYDKENKLYLDKVALGNGYIQYTDIKKGFFEGFIYEKLVYTPNLDKKIIVPAWNFHYSGVKLKKDNNSIEKTDNKEKTERNKKIEELEENALNNRGKVFKVRIEKD